MHDIHVLYPMNIFYVSHKPSRCARWHCDKHVVKMILESTQLLYTAHWVVEGEPNLSSAPCRQDLGRGYKSIKNKKHPSAMWTYESLDHYMWLCQLAAFLCQEYEYRFGSKKVHSCQKHIEWLTANPPPHLVSKGWVQPPQAMPEEYRHSNSIVAYRRYYLGAKSRLLRYTRRNMPHWIVKKL